MEIQDVSTPLLRASPDIWKMVQVALRTQRQPVHNWFSLGSVKYGNNVASVEKSRSRPYDPFLDLFYRLRVSGRPTGMVSRNKMMALSVHISIDLI